MKTRLKNLNIAKSTLLFLLSVSLERELHLSKQFLKVFPLFECIKKKIVRERILLLFTINEEETIIYCIFTNYITISLYI